MGTNQHAMTNNYAKSGGPSDLNKTDGKEFWGLRNKDKEYNEIVSRPASPKNELPHLERGESPMSSLKEDVRSQV